MEKYYKVSETELKDLLYCYHKLMALECGGLDNWEWYGWSISDYLANGEEVFNDLDELVEKEIKEYKEVR